MRPIYKSIALTSMTLSVSLTLMAEINDGESTVQKGVKVADLDGFKLQLIEPNVSGVRELVEGTDYVNEDGQSIAITFHAGNWIKGATYRLQAVATFGTQQQVIYSLDIEVPRYEELDGDNVQEFEDTIMVVSTYGDGDKSGADATVYAKDGDGNAHITTPLSIGNGVASGDGAIASGRVDGEGSSIEANSSGAIASGRVDGEGSSIEANSSGAIASGHAENGASIEASSDGSIASGYANGEGASIQAGGLGTMASGNADGAGASIQAGGSGTMASGYAESGSSIQAISEGAIASGGAYEGASIQASGSGAIASGYADATNGNVEASGNASQAFGIGVKATQDAQMVVGKCNVVDENGDYALIVGNGADDEHRSNAFAIDWNGNLVLFNAGTPVVLTPAKLATLIA